MDLIIKVKHEGTLRRFTVVLKEDGSSSLSLDALRGKIRQLFKFGCNQDMVITYTDEDKDVVTIADDADLMDAVQQGLNPLRLDVSLVTQPLNPAISSIANEQRKFSGEEGWELMLDALRKVSDPTYYLRKLAKNPIVESVTSSPAVSELMEGLVRVGSAHLGSLIDVQSGSGSRPNVNNTIVSPLSDSQNPSCSNSQPAAIQSLGLSAPPAALGDYLDTKRREAENQGQGQL
eukprot:Gb_41629 [translate_table: standard]